LVFSFTEAVQFILPQLYPPKASFLLYAVLCIYFLHYMLHILAMLSSVWQDCYWCTP